MADLKNKKEAISNNSEINLNKLSSEFVSKLVKAGVCVDPTIKDEKIQEREKERRKACYRCTETLMKKYRRIVYRISSGSIVVADELNKPFENVDKLINYVDTEYLLHEKEADARLSQLCEARTLINRVNIALTQLKNDPMYECCYYALYYRYIDTQNLKSDACADKLSVSVATYKRYLKEGLDELTTLLWTTSDVEVSLMLEALAHLKL